MLFLSTYVPRKCGIATFTRDLTTALRKLDHRGKVSIVAMDNDLSKDLIYPDEVVSRVRENEWADYLAVAKSVNESREHELVVIQHEYGIFGRNDGELVVDFVKEVKKPVVTTLHTILENPTPRQRKILIDLCERSHMVVVMLEAARDMLIEKYGIDASKVTVIHHGVPDFAKMNSEEWKGKLNLSGRVVMCSINLLSEQKGIEYVVASLPSIIAEVPEVIYLIVGQTHPSYLAAMGRDIYRERLEKMVVDLELSQHVKFINEYVSLEKLVELVTASDFYITAYLDPQQAASGALAYAIGAGKLCISTPYLYAQEMLGDGRGILVPFRDSLSISRAVCEMIEFPLKRVGYEVKTYDLGRSMIWSNVARQYQDIYNLAAYGGR